jgi:hypothetical protein
VKRTAESQWKGNRRRGRRNQKDIDWCKDWRGERKVEMEKEIDK